MLSFKIFCIISNKSKSCLKWSTYGKGVPVLFDLMWTRIKLSFFDRWQQFSAKLRSEVSEINCQELQNNLVKAGFHIHDSIVQKRLIKGDRISIRPQKKQLLTTIMMSKRYQWTKIHAHWTVENWWKLLFSDESHFVVQGQRSRFVRKSEKATAAHFDQTRKHPPKKMFWGCFSFEGTGSRVPIEGMMRSGKHQLIIKSFQNS